ncbi:MAG: aldo/keto reductase [Thaumarchaeota archaeon]|nr:aldo/keto reductase [Nitrososphaerota archaeon]
MLAASQKARVGETALTVSKVGLGGAPLGNLYQAVPGRQAVATVERAVDVGFTHIDTAPLYGFGLSEERIGQALKGRSRDEYTISTKVGRLIVPAGGAPSTAEVYWAAPRHFEAVFDFSSTGIKKSIASSKRRLGIEDIDMLLIHDCDEHVEEALGESYPVLGRMRERGEVKAVGAGLNSYETALKLAKSAHFDCFLLAGRYTLLEQGALNEFLPFCHDNKIGVIIGGPFNSGILASDKISPGARYDYSTASKDVLTKARRIEKICLRHHVPLRAAALQFVLANPVVTCVIPGCRSPREVESNARALNVRIPRPVWDELKEEGLVADDAPTPNG